MSNKYKIALSLSFVFAVLFVLPWLGLVEQVREGDLKSGDSSIPPRLVFLFFTVFGVSILSFLVNFSWIRSLQAITGGRRWIVALISNLLFVAISAAVVVILAIVIFRVQAIAPYFLIYFFRNLLITVMVVLVTYVVDLVERLKQERIEVLQLQKRNAETELAVLRSQVDPHFLFNTLTTLGSLVRSNNSEAVAFIDHMADTYRYMLENRGLKAVPVREELSFVESYLFMMKKRFEEGLYVITNIREEFLDRTIPQFSLQIVVENAIKHNVISGKRALRIEVESDDECIIVRNNLQKKISSNGHGMGLDNLAQRYWLMAQKKIVVASDRNRFEVRLPVL
jgi:two-component system LytT family sensor kinase